MSMLTDRDWAQHDCLHIITLSNFSQYGIENAITKKTMTFGRNSTNNVFRTVQVVVYVWGIDEEHRDYVSVTLSITDLNRYDVSFTSTISILDADNKPRMPQSFTYNRFCEGLKNDSSAVDLDIGLNRFVSRRKLFEDADELLPNDVFCLQCEVSFYIPKQFVNIIFAPSTALNKFAMDKWIMIKPVYSVPSIDNNFNRNEMFDQVCNIYQIYLRYSSLISEIKCPKKCLPKRAQETLDYSKQCDRTPPFISMLSLFRRVQFPYVEELFKHLEFYINKLNVTHELLGQKFNVYQIDVKYYSLMNEIEFSNKYLSDAKDEDQKMLSYSKQGDRSDLSLAIRGLLKRTKLSTAELLKYIASNINDCKFTNELLVHGCNVYNICLKYYSLICGIKCAHEHLSATKLERFWKMLGYSKQCGKSYIFIAMKGLLRRLALSSVEELSKYMVSNINELNAIKISSLAVKYGDKLLQAQIADYLRDKRIILLTWSRERIKYYLKIKNVLLVSNGRAYSNSNVSKPCSLLEMILDLIRNNRIIFIDSMVSVFVLYNIAIENTCPALKKECLRFVTQHLRHDNVNFVKTMANGDKDLLNIIREFEEKKL